MGATEANKITEMRKQQMEQTLQNAEKLLKSRNVKYQLLVGVVDEIREGLLKEADSLNADIVVVGSRGGSTLTKLIMGSVSDYVVKNAHIPVLVVP